MEENVIGIDFGTSNLVVAALVENDAEVLNNDINAQSTPACVHYMETGETDVGWTALRQAISTPAKVVRNVLTILGAPEVFVLEEIDRTPEEVTSVLFQQCETISHSHGYNCKRAVITVPQHFTEYQRALLLESAETTGLKEPRLITETAAMAMAYAFKKETAKQEIVLVVSVGGGAGSVCVAEVSKKSVTVIATSCKRLPGGNAIDKLMLQSITEKIDKGKLCTRSMEILRMGWEETKAKLSRHKVRTFGPYFLPSLEKDIEFQISRDDFNLTCACLFQEISNEVKETLGRAMVNFSQVDKVIGSGASMRIPGLQSAILKDFSLSLYTGNNLDVDVARGAVFFGNGIVSLREVKTESSPAPAKKQIFRPWEMDGGSKTGGSENKDGEGSQDSTKNSKENKKIETEKEKTEKKGEEHDDGGKHLNSESDSEDGRQNAIDLRAVLAYKRDNIYPVAFKGGKNKNLKRNFRLQAEPFHFNKENKKLYHIRAPRKIAKVWDPKKAREVVVDAEEQLKLLKSLHEGPDTSVEANALNGHRGRDKLYGLLDERYFWNGMYTDAEQYCRNCLTCKMVNPATLKVSDPMHPVPIPARAMAQVGIDIAQLPEVDGLKYICVAICYFTKYSEARALPDKSAAGVAQFVYDDIICRHGCPETFISDQGKEFCNELMSELFRLTGARQRVTSPYHPQANGLVERQNRTIKNTLLKVLHAKELQWPKILSGVLFAHRAAKHASTGFSPFFLMYRRQPRLPAELAKERGDSSSSEEDFGDSPQNENVDEKLDFDEGMFKEVFDKLCEVEDSITAAAMRNIHKAQSRQKSGYDKRHTGGQKLFIGQSVFLENMKRKDRKGGKLVECPRSGPYTVVAIDENKLVTLENEVGYILKTKYNIKRCIPYNIPKKERKRKSGVSQSGASKRPEDGSGKANHPSDKENPVSSDEDKNGPSDKGKPKPNDKGKQNPPDKEKQNPDDKGKQNPQDKEKQNPDDKGKQNPEDKDKPNPDDKDKADDKPGQESFNPPSREWKIEACRKINVKIKDVSQVSDGIPKMKPLLRSSKIQQIAGDGNCYFRSISFVLTGSENSHVTIRHKLVAFMKGHDMVAKYTGKTKAAIYVKESGMGNLKVYATDAEIFATALWLELDIYVEFDDGGWQRFSATGSLANPARTLYSIYIKNANRNHYEVVLDVV